MGPRCCRSLHLTHSAASAHTVVGQLGNPQSRSQGGGGSTSIAVSLSPSRAGLIILGVDTVEQVDDGILNSNPGLIGELEGIQVRPDNRPELIQGQGLHDMPSIKCTCVRCP